MFNWFYNFRLYLNRKKNLENWAFQVVSYNRLERDFIYKLDNLLAKEAFIYPELNKFLPVIDSYIKLALKEAVQMNANIVKQYR